MASLKGPQVRAAGVDRKKLPSLVQRVRRRPPRDPDSAARALTGLARLTWGDPAGIWTLLDRHGGAREALDAARTDSGAPAGPPESVRMAASAGIGGAIVLPYWDARYPAGLWRLQDPPPLLFFAGDTSLLERPALAVVGTRRCSAHGRAAARAIALAAGAGGVVVVSGHAQGIDAAAHEGALGSGTIAVLGCGLDVPYPRALASLRVRMRERGLLLSEFPAGTPPLPRHFPRRNRIIAALASALVVVEAPHRSGAQNTVSHALDMGLDVGAVPGPIDRANCAGSNRLLREGAAAICEPVHALELIDPRFATRPADDAPEAVAAAAASRTLEATTAFREAPSVAAGVGEPAGAGQRAGARRSARPLLPAEAVRMALAEAPATIDELAERGILGPAAVSAALLELELAGLVRRGPGGRFALGPAGRP